MTTMVDLTVEQFEGNLTHPGHGRTPLVLRGTVSHGTTFQRKIKNPYDGSFVSVANEYLLFTGHTGTHVDAPFHVNHDSPFTIEKVPLERFWGTAVWLDVSEHANHDGAIITDTHLEAAERSGGEPVRPGDIVLVSTGWMVATATDPSRYVSGSPGLARSAAEWLRARGIKALGVDLISPDCRDAMELPVHMNFLRPECLGLAPTDYILIYENVTNIETIPRRRFIFHGLPLPIRASTGSPVRAVAVVDC